MATRIERDSMGELEVPSGALYAAQTQRAINNFPVSGQPLPEAFIRALLKAKAAAARANVKLELLPDKTGGAIVEAVDMLLDNPELMQHFPVDVFQTGSGTSSNMNTNEVLATLAGRILDEKVSPNDHVNYGQMKRSARMIMSIMVKAVMTLSPAVFTSQRHWSWSTTCYQHCVIWVTRFIPRQPASINTLKPDVRT